MRIVVINTDYEVFLRDHYASHPGLAEQSHADQLRSRMQTMFGVADSYTHALRQLGHEAWDIHLNNRPLQEAWARENGIRLEPDRTRLGWRWRRGLIPWPTRRIESNWMHEALMAQLSHYRPDVVLNQAMDGVFDGLLHEVRKRSPLLIGQHAATSLPQDPNWNLYDLVVSSFPPTVEWFRARGVPAKYHRLAFDARVLTRMAPGLRKSGVTFIGSLMPVHRTRIVWLEALCELIDIDVYSSDLERLPKASAIRRREHGPVWGLEMYRVMRDSLITLNHHGDVPDYANNLRLYEATGVGTLLITDLRRNLQELFDCGKEVIAYSSAEECASRIRHFVDHEAECRRIAEAGQARTLGEHTFVDRMEELLAFIGDMRR
jgi:spore maturation protein CgeB